MLPGSWCAGHEPAQSPLGPACLSGSPRRASCAVFGNVFASESNSAIFPDGGPNGDPTQVDLYIENITYYYNADGGDHHLQTKINGKFAQINLDGPNNDKRGTSEHHTPHETTFKFEFRRRDNGQPVVIPWMQLTFFDFDENVLTDWLKQNGATTGDGREARLRPLPSPHPCENPIAPNRSALTPSRSALLRRDSPITRSPRTPR